MSLHPYEPYMVFAVKHHEPPPQVRILLVFITFLFPAEHPSFGDGIDHVAGIGKDGDFAAVEFEGLQSFDDGQQLHAVVRGKTESFAELFPIGRRKQYHTVPSSAGIALCRPVGIDGYLVVRHVNRRSACCGRPAKIR